MLVGCAIPVAFTSGSIARRPKHIYDDQKRLRICISSARLAHFLQTAKSIWCKGPLEQSPRSCNAALQADLKIRSYIALYKYKFEQVHCKHTHPTKQPQLAAEYLKPPAQALLRLCKRTRRAHMQTAIPLHPSCSTQISPQCPCKS